MAQARPRGAGPRRPGSRRDDRLAPVTTADQRPVLVVDFGAQYAQLIARRVRRPRGLLEIVPHSMAVEKMLMKDPARSSSPAEPRLHRLRRGRTPLDPALLGPACRCSDSATASSRWPRPPAAPSPRRVREYGATASRPSAPPRAALRPGRRPERVDEPRRLRDRGAGGLRRHPRPPPPAPSPPSRTARSGSTACSGTPRWATPTAARRCWRTSSTAARASSRPGPPATSSRSRSSGSAPRWARAPRSAASPAAWTPPSPRWCSAPSATTSPACT